MPRIDAEEQREMDEAAREFVLEFRGMVGKMSSETKIWCPERDRANAFRAKENQMNKLFAL